MKGFQKLMSVVLSAALLSGLMPVMAWASNSSRITSVELSFSSNIEIGATVTDDDVEVTTKSSKYDVDYIEMQNDSFGWSVGDVPELKVYLSASSDYYFSLASSDSIKLKGAGATYVSLKKEDNSTTLILTVKLASVGSGVSNASSDTTYDGSGSSQWNSVGLAAWTEIPDAESYEVWLFRNGKSAGKTRKVTGTSCDLSDMMTRAAEYRFKVRGLNLGGTDQATGWIESNSCTVDESMAAGFRAAVSTDPGWKKNATGWWYRNPDGGYTVNNWQSIDNKQYYFNESGYMVTGWVSWNGKWYYCAPSGELLANTTTPDGYALGNDGAWIQ